uniref:Tudor domain-containing protein n=1 Tax=Ascaris lumbricoides TaxID=6252 RepID=A0A0M3IWW6_ASCLU
MPRKESGGGKEAKDIDKEAVTKSGDATTLAYSLNDKVLCRHLDNLYYEAKIIAVEQTPDGEPIYTVHYQVAQLGAHVILKQGPWSRKCAS